MPRKTTRRKTTRRKTTRRRRRRRSNPSVAFKPLAIGAAAGLALGGGDFALAGQDAIPRKYQGLVEAAAGLLLGGIASMYQRDLGVGLAAAGVALGTAGALQSFVKSVPATTTTTKGLVSRSRPVAQLRAVQAPLGAVTAPIGEGAHADLSAVQALIEDAPSW